MSAAATRDLAAARALAVELAEAAGRLQRERRGSVVVHPNKAHANDPVSDVDHASERLIVRRAALGVAGGRAARRGGRSAPGSPAGAG